MKLKSLDLFSGLGGMTRALHGLAAPVGYCEINPRSQAVLRARMADGSLPRAPIFPDVTKLTAADIKGSVDVICGGWPCQDISTIGLRAGLKGARSGLIREVIRLTDELKPKMLFLENVGNMINIGMREFMNEFVNKRGFEVRWVVVPASALGAPHVRRRWFALVTRPGAEAVFTARLPAFRMTNWRKEGAPRMRIPRDAAEKKDLHARLAMLGNSVVPECARAAFITLFSGFRLDPTADVTAAAHTLHFEDPSFRDVEKTKKFYNWGVALPGGDHRRALLYETDEPEMKRPDLDLEVRPKAVRLPEKGFVTAPRLKRPMRLHSWPTPRHGMTGAVNTVTTRTTRDLPTVIRYEAKTPDHLRTGVTNPGFVEWMMGYPRGWTDVKPLKRKPGSRKSARLALAARVPRTK